MGERSKKQKRDDWVERTRRQSRLSNEWVVAFKVMVACGFLFISSMFFLDNLEVLWDDVMSWNPLPIIFVGGILVICAYIAFLVNRVGDRTLFRAERMDIIFKIVFSMIIIYISMRSLFADLTVPVPLVIGAVIIGLLNWLIPPVIINDSDEF